ncbi:hypothetical protein [Haloplanus salilacus]|uniref:hypothetical protein n=1 Tax=Haloplanus salilacus TaxID=2949994 RepID=UPI0030D5AABA
MASENNITEDSFSESLSRIDEYLGRLQHLPAKSTFKSAVEDDLWRAVTQKSNPSSEIKYDELPEVAHSLFGKFEEDGERLDPWWLHEFDWTAEFGGEQLTLRNDELESFAENFDRHRTLMQKARFREETFRTEQRSLYVIHDQLLTIKTELEKHIEADGTSAFPEFPEKLFNVEHGRVVISDKFDDWIDSFLELLPALGSEATALYLANTGTSQSSAKTALEPKLFEQLDRLGVLQDSGYNHTYVNPYETILGASWIANRRIPNGEGDSELAGLQYQLYRSFIETFEPADESTAKLFNDAMKSTPPKLNEGELGAFTRVACGSALILSNSRRPQLMTVPIYSVNTSGKSGYQSNNYRAIRKLFERNGWFEHA